MKQWLKDAVFYEIYPQSFYDTNGDGIGDLKGIIEKLDYIKELGCNALWINPCFDSPFKDAGYDVRDYKLIAPRYGTNADAKALFEAAHAKGIHVLLDLVPGHTSEEHAWFKESSKPEKNEYSDRYIWTDSCFSAGDGMPFIGGETDRNGTYILNFFKCQPALNYGYGKCREKWQMPTDAPGPRATVEAVKDVMRFWLDMGCDGFRVDMASSLVKNDTHHKKYTCAIWRDIAAMLDKEYPEAALVSEWNQPRQSLKNGFDMDCRTDVENPDKAWYIIDPNTGNLHDSPYLDYGKLLQSLHGGYEFMMMTPRCTVQENHIDFQLTRSAAYDTLFEAVCDDLRTRCGAAGLHSILAHELIHWLRLMPYKLNKDKKRAPMFYAGLVMVANDLNTWENEGKFDEKARTDRR